MNATPEITPALVSDFRATRTERALLSLLHNSAGILRSDLPRLLDLSQATVHRLVDRVQGLGWVTLDQPRSDGNAGKPSPRVHIRGDAAYSFGITIKTDSVVLCLMNLVCQVVEQTYWRTTPLSRDETLKRLKQKSAQMLRRNGISRSMLAGAGVAMSGYFYDESDKVTTTKPLHDWAMIDVKPLLEEALGLPVSIGNDANCAALGESYRGAGRRYATFVYLYFHYGFGAGVVVDHHAYVGAHGNAGELGPIYAPDETNDRPALETLVQLLSENGRGIETIEDLAERFDVSWPEVEVWVNRVSSGLNKAVHAMTAAIDPQAIIFGGGLPVSLAELLIREVHFPDHHGQLVRAPRPVLLPGESDGDVSSCGAAILPLQALFFF